MVARKGLSRKALFAAALVEAGMSAPEFAAQVERSTTSLHRTLRDPSTSAPLTKKIDDFIAKHVGNRVTALAS